MVLAQRLQDCSGALSEGRMYSAARLGRAILWGVRIGMEGSDRMRIEVLLQTQAMRGCNG